MKRAHLEMTRWLLDNDTRDINVKRGRKTALDLAIKKEHTEMAELLRERGVEETT